MKKGDSPILRAVKEFIARKEFRASIEELCQKNKEWQVGFALARRVMRCLADEGVPWERVRSEEFCGLIVAWCEVYYEGEMGEEELWLQFSEAWVYVNFPEGMDTLWLAVYRVKQKKISGEIPDGLWGGSERSKERARLLAAVVRELSDTVKRPYLTYRSAGEVLGISHTHAGSILKRLKRLGIIKEVGGHVTYPKNSAKETPVIRWVPPECRPKDEKVYIGLEGFQSTQGYEG